MSKRKPVHGSSALIIHESEILLFLRDDIPTIPYPNCWSLPGGTIEEGETPHDALVRELREEVTYVPKTIHPIGKKIYKTGDTVYLYVCFINVNEKKLFKHNPGEGQGIDFHHIDSLETLNTTPVIKKYTINFNPVLLKIFRQKYIPNPSELDLITF